MAERVLITGGEGFLGRHLQMYFNREGILYDTLDRDGLPRYRWDIRHPLPNIRGYDRVIHLAGLLGTHELFRDVFNAIDVNIKGTVNVLNWAVETGASFHGVTMAHVWENPYETTKLAAERLARAWSREYGVSVTYTTVYNAYGEYQAVGGSHPQKIIPTFARAAWEGKPIPIWGDGEQIVDLVYAGHVAQILGDGVAGVEGGYGHPLTVNEVADLVWGMVHDDDEAPKMYLPMRRGEHKPLRDPVATSPLITQEFLPTLQRTVEWYRP